MNHPATSTTDERPTGRHPVNVGHLVMGIAFLGLVGVWALIQGDVVGDGDVRWLLPVPWVLAGLAGLLAVGLSGSKRWSTRQTGWVGTTETSRTGWVGTTDTTTVLETEPGAPDSSEENR
ncbi:MULTISPECIES: hypothetical protein [unclassified Nocardioides]|uniref:hypothetical protein n=1 Tax=unclassified Nocardioides TaxID=2615069 RepID=UPI0009F1560E|nr:MULTISPECIES: hypothetical protein [unclassified Nocardioides]GAW52051.1 uncharacterized protein PD653B2_4401 [Nocardioides sp. PD653-B2]GAW55221.1 uncharacterized protein PD653_2641 [Nocardioides sp. PD653]